MRASLNDSSTPTDRFPDCGTHGEALLLTVEPDRHLELTEEGRHKAVEVMRKHRLAERLLSDIIGLELEYVHEEACRWEHVMSDKVEKRILEMLKDPKFSPYGNAIPTGGSGSH